jgi:hypothetical protein
MRTLKHGQHMTRVIHNENECTMGPELTLWCANHVSLTRWYNMK